MFCKEGILGNFTRFTGKHLCQSLFFNEVAGLRPATLLKKQTLIQVFSYEFCEICKNTFFHRTHLVAACVHLVTHLGKECVLLFIALLKQHQRML